MANRYIVDIGQTAIEDFKVSIPAHTFYCGDFDTENYISVEFEAGVIEILPTLFGGIAELWITPLLASSPEFPNGSQYYLDHRENDPDNPPPILGNIPKEKFSSGMKSIMVARFQLDPLGRLTTFKRSLIFYQNEHLIPDSRKAKDIDSNTRVEAFASNAVLKGWVKLNIKDHPDLFPLTGLGSLDEGEAWFVRRLA